METNSPRPVIDNASLLKQINSVRILGLLRCHTGLSRAEIARRTGLNRSTVTVITAELIEDGLVREGAEMGTKPGGGRPGVELKLDPKGAFFIGAAIEADHIRVVELNLAAQVTQRICEPLPPSSEPNVVMRQLLQMIAQVRHGNPDYQLRLRGIGLTVPGSINRKGLLIRVPGLNWYSVNLRQHLEAQIDVPLFIDNDANAAALAEVYLGSAVQSQSLLYLLLNEGVGSGIVQNNRLLRGANGTAGEVCELLVDAAPAGGSEYGQPGSLGTLVGKAGLLQQYRVKGAKQAELTDLVQALQRQDEIAQFVVNQWAKRLGAGMIQIINVLNPDQIVLGGPLTVLLPYVADQLNDALRKGLPRNGADGFFSTPNACWRVSEFGEDASVIGGALLVYQSLFQMPDLGVFSV
ncbi:MAG: ROK family protein [Thainema sp.]